jgi:glycosyltransferase involved in cell wall biosynthesis
MVYNENITSLRDRNILNETDILLTVYCWVYNDEINIKRCIESILDQRTSFDVEIILHDDASSDGTVEIIKEYEKKYPKLFKNVLNKFNQYSLGKSVTTPMFEKSNGKYIALLHGDDYWTDSLKLEKQVCFLDKNQNFSMCFHKVNYNDGDFTIGSYYKTPSRFVLNSNHIIKEHYIATSSLVYRKDRLNLTKEMYSKFYLNDIYLEILISFTGYTYYFSEIMGVYNKNPISVSNNAEYLKKGRDNLILIYYELLFISPLKCKAVLFYKLLYNFFGKYYDFLVGARTT